MSDLAIALVRAGFAVFPVKADKTPATPHGFKDAARDVDTAERLFKLYPAALIGVATGPMSAAAVVDIDPPLGQRWLADHHELLPPTIEVRTRRGGLHLWYRTAAMIPTTTGRIAPNVDTRGAGGYAIAWNPSALLEGEMAPWPEVLTEALRPKPRPPASVRYLPAPETPEGKTRYARAALIAATSLVATAKPGTRNQTLNIQAFCLARLIGGGGVTEGEIYRYLGRAAVAVGLPQLEAERTIASAIRARRQGAA